MAEKKAIPAVGRNRGLGMVMHRKVVDELKRLGLSCHPYLTVVFQQKQKRWMLAGEEGGGSTADVGHYVGFTGVTPSGIAVSIPIQSLVPNSTQRRVIAQEMIRAQIFRYGNSCNLLVTYHWLNSAGDSERPTLDSHRLFYHRNGILAPGTKQPVFFDRAGEPIDTPPELVPLIQAVTDGVLAQKNHRVHCIPVPGIKRPDVPTPKPRTVTTPPETAPIPGGTAPREAVGAISAASGRKKGRKGGNTRRPAGGAEIAASPAA